MIGKIFSPGRLLLIKLLKWSIINKLSIYDFTIGGEAYKKIWCNKDENLYFSLKSITLKGKIYSTLLFWKFYIKKSTILLRIARKIKSYVT